MHRQVITLVAAFVFGLMAGPGSCAAAQTALQSVAGEAHEQVRLAGSISPQVAKALDVGRIAGNESVRGVTLLLRQSAAQKKALQELLAEQQTPGAVRYRKWISPAQYASQFGLSEGNIEEVEQWLTSEGFSRFSLNSSHTALSFDASTSRLEQAFSTEIHQYRVQGEILLANAVDLQLPPKMLPYVGGVKGISHFRPTPQIGSQRIVTAKPELNSLSGDEHYLSPGDVSRIYDFDHLLAEGRTGKGLKIAVVGQSAIQLEDVARFRAAAGLGPHSPNLVLVPGSGTPLERTGDERESDVDVEYAGAMAPDADVTLVYTGSDPGYNVFDALAYAVDQDIAPIISVSYGECEGDISGVEVEFLERVLLQASLQGQTVLAGSGDLGAAGCETEEARLQGAATRGLAVQYPASSPYVISVGGTMLDDSASTSYWASSNFLDGKSAQGYIPERAWNESSGPGRVQLLGGGGGASALFPKPVWQAGPGVPMDGARDVPDFALAAGIRHDGFVFCSSDQAAGVQGSCSRGFFDAPGLKLTVAGGTSFGAPIAAGIVALLEQTSGAGGLGNVNALLYRLASTDAHTFHDITAGDNRQPCRIGSKDCDTDGTFGFFAGPGYDQATGLGSPDVGQLAAALETETVAPPASISLRQLDAIAYTGAPIRILATVGGPSDGASASIQFCLDGKASGSPIFLHAGQAVYSFSSTMAGLHEISAAFNVGFPGAAATARIEVQVQIAPAVPAAFALSSTPFTSPNPDQAAAAVMVTPSAAYFGRVTFQVTTSDPLLAQYGCYLLRDVTVQANTPAQTTLFVARSPAACTTLMSQEGSMARKLLRLGTTADFRTAKKPTHSPRLHPGLQLVGSATELCGVLLLSGVGKRLKLSAAGLVTTFSFITLCTGCSVHPVQEQAAPGSYLLLITAVDAGGKAQTASVSVSVDLK